MKIDYKNTEFFYLENIHMWCMREKDVKIFGKVILDSERNRFIHMVGVAQMEER